MKELTGQHDRIPRREINAQDCENFCEHSHPRDVWLSSEDKFFCEDCLAEYYREELEAILSPELYCDETMEDFTFIAHTYDNDDFTYFVALIGSKKVEISRYELEKKRNG